MRGEKERKGLSAVLKRVINIEMMKERRKTLVIIYKRKRRSLIFLSFFVLILNLDGNCRKLQRLVRRNKSSLSKRFSAFVSPSSDDDEETSGDGDAFEWGDLSERSFHLIQN